MIHPLIHRRSLLYLVLLTSMFSFSYARANDASVSETTSQRLSVYVSGFPDLSFLAEKIDYALFVNEEDSAQVLIRITEIDSSGADTGYTISLTGQKELRGINDRLHYAPRPGETAAESQRRLSATLKAGLIKYAARTPVAESISIEHTHTEEEIAAVKDKWNYWLFSVSLYSQVNGEKSYKGQSLGGGFSARRITDAWKMRADVSTNYNENTYELEEIGLSYRDITKNHNFDGLLVKSLGDHWSVGAFTNASQATYYNRKLSCEFAPAIEYNIYPYIESESRSFTFLYRLGGIYKKYWEETIYGKTNEALLQTSLTADVEIYKSWGSIESSLTGSAYLKDLSQNRLTWYFEIDVQLFKQLTFDIEWRVSAIHDQIFLARGGASLEEVLLRRKRLETRYDYSIDFGISFRFGSLNNRITNPIFN